MRYIAVLSFIAILVLSFNDTANAKREKAKAALPKKESPVRIIDTDFRESPGDPDKGAKFVLKNVPVTMNDTRYVEGWLSRSMTLQVSARNFQDPALFEQIKANCSTIGVHDKAQKDEIEKRSACKLNLYGEFSAVLKQPFYIRETFLTKEEKGYIYTYYFEKVRLATASEIDPPTTTVTAEELRLNGRKYIGQWVSMDGVVVRNIRGDLLVEIGGENFVQVSETRKLDSSLLEHIKKRCYEDIEYKDIYKPEECTYNVKFHVFDVRKRDAGEMNIMESGKKGDIVSQYFSFN